MNLAEIFHNPFDPNKSIQLNNKYWPSDNYTILSLLEDCEATISERGIDLKSMPLTQLRRLFHEDIYYQKMLWRLRKIQCFQTVSGYLIENVPINDGLLEAIKYSGDQDSLVMPLPNIEKFSALSKKN